MKSRQGFVSNSSSSSFLIYGTYIEPSELALVLLGDWQAVGETIKLEAPFTQEDVREALTDMGSWDLADLMYSHKPKGFDLFGNSEVGYYLGRCYSSIGDDETGKQFRQSTEEAIKAFLPQAHVSCIQETYYS